MPVTVRGTDILFNDATTQSTAAVVNTTSVLNATAGASVGAVGSYAQLAFLSGGNAGSVINAGSTISGSNLRYAANNSGAAGGLSSPSGTWRCMTALFLVFDGYGNFTYSTNSGGVFLRIS